MWYFEQFKKQGGFQFLKNLYTTNSLLYAFLIAPFFVGSKKGMEIFRLAISNKTFRYMVRKFKGKKVTYGISDDISKNSEKYENTIWFMWLQGIDFAPELVKCNLRILQKRFGNDRVKVITESNLTNFIDIPSFIKNKVEKGIISPTHFSDIIRIQLLATYGGIWIDSTVLFTGDLLNVISNQSFFVPQILKPGKDGKSISVSNWLIIAKRNDKIVTRLRDLLFNYWETFDKPVDYFIFHYLLMIVFDELPKEYQKIVPFDNSQPHALLIAMKTKDLQVNDIKNYIQLSPFHKLTNKVSSEMEIKNQETLIEFIKNDLLVNK